MRKGNGAEMGRLGAGRCVEEPRTVRNRKTPLKDNKVDKGKDREPDV